MTCPGSGVPLRTDRRGIQRTEQVRPSDYGDDTVTDTSTPAPRSRPTRRPPRSSPRTASDAADADGRRRTTGRDEAAAEAARPPQRRATCSGRARSPPTTSRGCSTSSTTTATSTSWCPAGRPVVEVVGGRLQPLVGQRGATLEALQELTRLAIFRQTGSPSRLLLDVGGYRGQPPQGTGGASPRTRSRRSRSTASRCGSSRCRRSSASACTTWSTRSPVWRASPRASSRSRRIVVRPARLTVTDADGVRPGRFAARAVACRRPRRSSVTGSPLAVVVRGAAGDRRRRPWTDRSARGAAASGTGTCSTAPRWPS